MLAKSPSVLVTLDDVRGWKRQRESMTMQIADLDRKLKAIAIFLSEDDRIEIFGTPDIPGMPKSRDEQAAVSRFALEMLEQEKRGLSAIEVAQLARHSELAAYVEENPSVVEDCLLRHARHGKVKKNGHVFYHPLHVEEKPKQSRNYGEAEHFRGLLLAEIEKCGVVGITPSDAIALLKGDPAGQIKLTGNPQYPYSLLGRMVDKEQIVKRDGRFYPAASSEEFTNSNGRPA